MSIRIKHVYMTTRKTNSWFSKSLNLSVPVTHGRVEFNLQTTSLFNYFLVILKETLKNYWRIMKICFLLVVSHENRLLSKQESPVSNK